MIDFFLDCIKSLNFYDFDKIDILIQHSRAYNNNEATIKDLYYIAKSIYV